MPFFMPGILGRIAPILLLFKRHSTLSLLISQSDLTNIKIIIIMSLTPVSFSDEVIGGVPSMQSSYSAGMKRCGICMEERSP